MLQRTLDEVIGDLATPIGLVLPDETTEQVHRRFELDPDLGALGVPRDDGRIALLTRDRLTAVVSGLRTAGGTGTHRLRLSAVEWSAEIAELPADTPVPLAIELLRSGGPGSPSSELLVRYPGDRYGVVTGTTLLEHVSSVYAHRSLHDPLTGLPNRALLADRVTHLRDHRDRAEAAVLLFVDLDGFKTVNDTYGHEVGDRLLVAVAERLLESVRDHDTVSRIGGDEFVIVLEDLEHPTDAEVIAERMLDRLREPVRLAGTVLHTDASVGLARMSRDVAGIEEVLQRADQAMYEAKHTTGSALVWWGDDLTPARTRSQVEALRTAIDTGRIEVWFQPKVAPWNHRLEEVEALARWHDGQRWVPPSEFIPLARAHGLIGALGRHVRRRACEVVASINADAQEPVRLAVNVAAEELVPDLLVDVARTLVETGLDVDQLRLEIDDADVPDSLGDLADLLHELDRLGVRLSLGGFGRGHDSMVRLAELPISEIKLDRSLLPSVSRSRAVSVARMVVAAAHELDVDVTAELVETQEQADLAVNIDIDLVQGHHCGHPMHAEAFEQHARAELGTVHPGVGGSAAGRRATGAARGPWQDVRA